MRKDPYSPFFKNLETMAETHKKKNHDYAGDEGTYFNFEYAAVLAKPFDDPFDKVFATMIGIKLARLSVLKNSGKKPLNESIEDSLKDLATYATIWWTYYCEEVESEQRGRVRSSRVRQRISGKGNSRTEWLRPTPKQKRQMGIRKNKSKAKRNGI